MHWMRRGSFFGGALVFVVVGLVSVELASFLLTKARLFSINETPKLYRLADSGLGLDDWYTEKDEWGAWHTPNAWTTHTSHCFSVEYHSNEAGARDRPFTVDSPKPRYLLIGDSMTEGYGVKENERAQAHIERVSQMQLLNFGAAGAFGPVQYWLIYEKLARRYKHEGVIIFFYPANDFTDNDYEFWLRTGITYVDGKRERYRPYYAPTKDGTFTYFYPPNAERGSKRSLPKQLLIEYLWSANALRTFRIAYLQRAVAKEDAKKRDNPTRPYSGYFDATSEQQRAAVYFVDKLLRESQAKDHILVAIPTHEDFARIASGQERGQTFWWTQFKSAGERLGKPVKFVDLSDFRPPDIAALFNVCDGHWSPYGNRWAGETVARFLPRM